MIRFCLKNAHGVVVAALAVAVVSGLKPGATVVVSSAGPLREGQKVRLE